MVDLLSVISVREPCGVGRAVVCARESIESMSLDT